MWNLWQENKKKTEQIRLVWKSSQKKASSLWKEHGSTAQACKVASRLLWRRLTIMHSTTFGKNPTQLIWTNSSHQLSARWWRADDLDFVLQPPTPLSSKYSNLLLIYVGQNCITQHPSTAANLQHNDWKGKKNQVAVITQSTSRPQPY